MVDRAHLVCVILATATFSFQSPPFYLVISPRTKGRKENRTFTMSQRRTKKKISDTAMSLCGVGTALSAALSRVLGATFLGWRLGRQERGWATHQMGLRLMLFYSGFLASSSKEEGKKKNQNNKPTNQPRKKNQQNPFGETITDGSVPLPCVF